MCVCVARELHAAQYGIWNDLVVVQLPRFCERRVVRLVAGGAPHEAHRCGKLKDVD
jgi:hypothetical protein